MKTTGFALLVGFAFASAGAHAADGSVYLGAGVLENSRGGQVTFTGALGIERKLAGPWAVDIVYLNEGHLENNHRDGFALLGAYSWTPVQGIVVRLAAGPYYAMNTTTLNGMEINQKTLGGLATLALRSYLGSSPYYLFAQLDRTWMRTFDTNGLLLGFGADLEPRPQTISAPKLDLEVWAGPSKSTIHEGTVAAGLMFDVRKRLGPEASVSTGLLVEGDSRITNRFGVFAMLWADEQLSRRWTISAGVGPYYAHDRITASDRWMGVAGLKASAKLSNEFSASASFIRVISTNQRDTDVFLFGITKAF